jgi:hypothetical protein
MMEVAQTFSFNSHEYSSTYIVLLVIQFYFSLTNDLITSNFYYLGDTICVLH